MDLNTATKKEGKKKKKKIHRSRDQNIWFTKSPETDINKALVSNINLESNTLK